MENHKQPLPNLETPFNMIAVKGGTFEMGGESWNDNAKPIHPVEVSDFWIGEFPVTQELWEAVMNNNPAHFKGQKRPVETVSWQDITEKNGFLEKLNKITVYTDLSRNNREGGLFCRPKGTAYRLPTEAEWEYAARGGNQSGGYTYSGGEKMNELGWFDDNAYGETMPVGLKWANELGIYDMSGNVWEWCADWYNDKFYQKCFDKSTFDKRPAKNPVCEDRGQLRVDRGGCWYNYARFCRLTYRYSYTPTYRLSNIGFRLVLFSLSV